MSLRRRRSAQLWNGHPPESFGRIHHLTEKRLAMVMDGLPEPGLIDTDGHSTATAHVTKQLIAILTDQLATPPYDALSPADLDELVTPLQSNTAALRVADSQCHAGADRCSHLNDVDSLPELLEGYRRVGVLAPQLDVHRARPLVPALRSVHGPADIRGDGPTDHGLPTAPGSAPETAP
ncbi:helix-turn-helix domain-containing protein [Streptomyces sp. NPDC001073]